MNAKAPLMEMTIKDYNKDHSKNRGTKPGYETYRGVKLGLRSKLQNKDSSVGGTLDYRLEETRLWIALQEDRSLQAQGYKTVDKDARVRHVTCGNTLAQDKGDADYLST